MAVSTTAGPLSAVAIYRDNQFMVMARVQEHATGPFLTDWFSHLIPRRSGPGPLLSTYIDYFGIVPRRLLVTQEGAGTKAPWAKRWASGYGHPSVPVDVHAPDDCDLASVSADAKQGRSVGNVRLQGHRRFLCLVPGSDGEQVLWIDSSGDRTPVDVAEPLPPGLRGMELGTWMGEEFSRQVQSMMSDNQWGVLLACLAVPGVVIVGSVRQLHRTGPEDFGNGFSQAFADTVKRKLLPVAEAEASREGPGASPAPNRVAVPQLHVGTHRRTLQGLLVLATR